MTLNKLLNELTRLMATGVDLNTPVWIEGLQDEDIADRVFFLRDSDRVYITRLRNGDK